MDNNNVLLSIVVPVYNVEAFLPECIDSVLPQMTDDCELILVDDGSKDSSGAFCDKCASEHDNVFTVHKENGGLSSARNAGMVVANGEYVTFIDSDDKIFPDTIEKLLEWIGENGADFCFLQSVKLFPDGSTQESAVRLDRKKLQGCDKVSALDHITSRRSYPGSAWAKLIRRELLSRNDLHFPYDRRYSEDLGFILSCLKYAESYDVLDFPFYMYRQNRAGSITNTVSAKNYYDLYIFISESASMLADNRKPRDLISEYLMGVVAYEYFVSIFVYNHLPPEENTDAKKKLNEYKWVMRYARSPKVKIAALLCRLFGTDFAACLIKMYRK